jgi:hypothetical protein
MTRAIGLIVVLALAAGCEQDEPAPTSAPTSKPSATSTELTDAEVDKAEIPVAADFAKEAEEQITEDNLDEVVAGLAMEINGEEGGTEPAKAPAGEEPSE